MAGGIEVVDPPEEIPSGQQFLRQLPERARWAEETAFIVDIFSHVGQAHQHLSEVCVNVAALANITDKSTLMSVINGAVWPLVQLNIPEGFLNPIKDKKALTSDEEKKEKVKKMVLPIPDATCLKHEPRNGPTRILTAAVWLKLSCKYFNEGTAREACERFNIRAKQFITSVDWLEVLGWYTSPQAQGHRRTTSQTKEVQQLKTRHDTTTTPLHHLIHAYGEKPL